MAQVLSHQMMEIPDKCAVDDASLTTDGIGMIRESFAKQVRASLGLSEDTSGKTPFTFSGAVSFLLICIYSLPS